MQKKVGGGISEEKEEIEDQSNIPHQQQPASSATADVETTETPSVKTPVLTAISATTKPTLGKPKGGSSRRYYKRPVLKLNPPNKNRVSILETVKANSKKFVMENTISDETRQYGYNRFVQGNIYTDDDMFQHAVSGICEYPFQKAFFPNCTVIPNPLFEFDNLRPRRYISNVARRETFAGK